MKCSPLVDNVSPIPWVAIGIWLSSGRVWEDMQKGEEDDQLDVDIRGEEKRNQRAELRIIKVPSQFNVRVEKKEEDEMARSNPGG